MNRHQFAPADVAITLRSVDKLVTHRVLDLAALCDAAHDAVGVDGQADHRVRRLLSIARALLDDLANDVNSMAEGVGCNAPPLPEAERPTGLPPFKAAPPVRDPN